MATAKELVEALIESPWDAEDLLREVSKADKAAVRAELLGRAKDKNPDSGVMTALGQFPDAEVITALAKVVTDNKADSDVVEAAAEAICEMETPEARTIVDTFFDHEDNGVVRIAIENVQDKPAALVKRLLSLFELVEKRGDDLMMHSLVGRLEEAAPTDKNVVAAFAKHWDFSVKHKKTLMASNAIFDALIEHAPDSPVAQGAFEAALASGTEYGIVRGRAALALTGHDAATHVKELKKMKGLQPSSSSLRSAALKKLGAK